MEIKETYSKKMYNVKDAKDKAEAYVYEACKNVSIIQRRLSKEIIDDKEIDEKKFVEILSSFAITNFMRVYLFLLKNMVDDNREDDFRDNLISGLMENLKQAKNLLDDEEIDVNKVK